MNYTTTSETLLARFLSQLPASSRNAEPFVDYVLKCYEEGMEPDWPSIARHVSKYKLRQLRYAERCINISYHKHFDAMLFVTENLCPLPRKKLIP